MTDPRGLLARYLQQRAELGDGPYVLDRPDAWTEPPAREAPKEPKRSKTARKAAGESDVPRWKRDAPAIPEGGIVVPSPADDLFTKNPLAALDLDGVAEHVRGCDRCALAGNRTNAVPGEGAAEARLVVVGEGPGATEDETGRPFVGRAGELLTEILAAIDLPRETVFICNVVKCRPPDNRKPLPDEIAKCVPFLHRQLEILRPKVILAMGATAAETLLGVRQSLGQLRNKVHEFRGTPLVVTYHPAALLRNPNWKKPTWDDVRIARQLLERR